MSRSFLHCAGAALVLAGVAAACGGRIHSVASTEPVPAGTSTLDRMTVRTGEQAAGVDPPPAAGRGPGGLVQEGGRAAAGSRGRRGGEAQIEARPARGAT